MFFLIYKVHFTVPFFFLLKMFVFLSVGVKHTFLCSYDSALHTFPYIWKCGILMLSILSTYSTLSLRSSFCMSADPLHLNPGSFFFSPTLIPRSTFLLHPLSLENDYLPLSQSLSLSPSHSLPSSLNNSLLREI